MGGARVAWAVAAHEARRVVPRGPRPIALAVALAAAAALLGPAALERGVHPDEGIYPVAVAPGSALEPALRADARFRVVEGGEQGTREPDVALAVGAGPDDVWAAPDRRGRAARAALSEAVAAWLEGEMEGEADAAAAFPVAVNVVQEPRSDLAPQGAGGVPAPANGTAAQSAILQQTDAAAQRTALRPGEVEPPFPVRSLVLAFAYLIPLNFIAQLLAASLLGERVRHRGVLLLSGPWRPVAVLWGRVLPYAGLGLAAWVVAGAAIGAGWQGWLASLPIVGFVLVGATLIGLLARSERELTFLLTALTTLFATFLFLPAVFTALPPVAFLSPVAVVAASIRGEAVGWALFAEATLPLALVVAALAAMAGALYREETLFSARPLGAKLLDGFARLGRTRAGLLATGVLLVPFARILLLFVLALVIPLGLTALFPAFLVGVALVEEGLKMMPSLARRRDAPDRPAFQYGLLVGGGFFLGEKIALIVALVGFGLLPLGGEALRVLGVGGGLLLVAPLLLHVAATTVAASGPPGRAKAWAAYAGAVALHVAYNVAVLTVGSGLGGLP